jgi:hypothetical protein
MLPRVVLEQMTRRFVLRRRCRALFVRFRICVSSEAGLRYLRPSLGATDPDLLRFAAELVRPGDVVWTSAPISACSSLRPRGCRLARTHSCNGPDAVLIRLFRRSAIAN